MGEMLGSARSLTAPCAMLLSQPRVQPCCMKEARRGSRDMYVKTVGSHTNTSPATGNTRLTNIEDSDSSF